MVSQFQAVLGFCSLMVRIRIIIIMMMAIVDEGESCEKDLRVVDREYHRRCEELLKVSK